ncbi:Uncharacterised protein [Aggregatibacter actinomycetemcomitans]|uniref:hypothetical protein n=1 Tax=Aggregatibacter actinomycetemcomitans TaxID=714 RepID=UPI00036E2167|nr:hypothetical protein [Aggregatibacter actinomycetemcomitans]ANN81539.1 hypothetical protein D11S_02505 [Aggregatibacter actinomycetemcomitans D11S-1]KOE57659.1 hypothetical protein SCC2302_0308795 [Aggregatibacter actinomycetemcomitans serotype c str. SCC2302]KOE61036.1 hypothetical protein AAS4A_0201810 [Aggregatibacter actinomycetemcomitans serotype c str. AAS4A]KOE62935.1 hypothetical protein D17P2_0301190 [Aggregatibacter actinomycetemcomitans serotype c str. D17P-2]KYK74081.1 hypotheti
MLNQAKSKNGQTHLQERVLSMFDQSLTEEQRFLQGVLNGKIKTYSHEDVMKDLRKALKR